MAYTNPDFKNAKVLRDAVAAGREVTVYSPGPFPCATEGEVFVEGPHYPKPHSWYTRVLVVNSRVVAVHVPGTKNKWVKAPEAA